MTSPPSGENATRVATTSFLCARNASASRAPRATIWSDGSTVGRAVMPSCRSIRMSAVAGSSVAGMGVLLAGRSGLGPDQSGWAWEGGRIARQLRERCVRIPPLSIERRLHRRGQQSRQLTDVIDRVEIEDGVLDRRLALRGDHTL